MITRFLAADLVVKDIETAAKRWSEILGVQPKWQTPAHYPGNPSIRGCAFYIGNKRVGNSKFTLMSSDGDDAIAKFLRDKGEGILSINFEVENIEEDMEHLKKCGVEFISEDPMVFDEGRVIIAHPKSLYNIQVGFAEPSPELGQIIPPPAE